jgi:hypothetical protein
MRLIIAKIGDDKTVSYATDELIRLIKAMDKSLRLDVRSYNEKNSSVKSALWIGLDGTLEASKDDHILINVENGAGVITGSNERSVLMGVYRFMYELGCRFLYPGADGEKIPPRTLDYKDLNIFVDETPSYKHRGICIEGSVSFEHVFNTINWLPKVGMNTFYSQFFVPAVFFKRYYKKFSENENDRDFGNTFTDDDVAAMLPVLEEEIAKRGLVYQAIGHGWSSAPYGFYASGWERYDGEISADLKEVLAMYNGERKFFQNMPISTQLCYSNPKVQEKVTDFAVEYCKEHKNIHYLSFVMGDGGRNHCECDECRKKTPSDFYIEMLNMLDVKFTKAGLDTKIMFSAYADTLFAPKYERLRKCDRFVLKLAPIARSFSQSYDEIDLNNLPETAPFVLNQDMKRNTVALNIAYFYKWKETYDGECCLFDYHMMWDHHTDPGYFNTVKTLHRDIVALEKIGFSGLISCQLLRSAFPTGLPQYVLGNTLWNKTKSFEEIKDEYFTAAFVENGKAVSEYLEEISNLACPEFVRGKIIPGFIEFSRDEVIDRYSKMKTVVKTFSKDYIQKFKEASADWQYLDVHSTLVCLFAEIYMAKYSLDDKKVEELSNRFRAFVKESENIIDAVCDDMYLCDTVLGKFLSRHEPEADPNSPPKPIFYEY